MEKLSEALDLDMTSCRRIGLVGGGGKTTALFRLAREALEAGLRVIITTTTHMKMERGIPLLVDAQPEAVAEAVIRMLMPFKEHVLTITTDNGGEFRCHRKIAERLATTVYFADSYASWQKGAIEKTNKLIRQYIPKGTDFRLLTDEFIRNVQYKINRRPREKLNFYTPKECFFKLFA